MYFVIDFVILTPYGIASDPWLRVECAGFTMTYILIQRVSSIALGVDGLYAPTATQNREGTP